MPTMSVPVEILSNHPVQTWFGCGGSAARFARPANAEALRACLAIDRNLRILGDGANLLVADGGVQELVVSLNSGDFAQWTVTPTPTGGIIRAGAGVNLPKLILEAGRLGLGGLEALGGIPASVGGAVVMNAGGNFGQTGDTVHAVEGLTRDGQPVSLRRNQIDFTYRHARFAEHKGLIVTHVEFKLKKADPDALRERLKEVMAYKKKTQPLADHSAGCFFKNPTLREDLPGIAVAGSKISAGMLIDKAGCKSMRIGGAAVSPQHANFVIADKGCTAADILALMRQVREKVRAAFNVTLENEVVIWGASL